MATRTKCDENDSIWTDSNMMMFHARCDFKRVSLDFVIVNFVISALERIFATLITWRVTKLSLCRSKWADDGELKPALDSSPASASEEIENVN